MARPKRNFKAVVPMSSLADIAFLLLIFFLVTTTIDVDRGIGLVLPGKNSTPVHPKNIATLLINGDDDLLWQGDQIRVEAIARKVKKSLLENPKLIVSIQSHRRARYRTYVTALDQLKIAGARRISLAEPER